MIWKLIQMLALAGTLVVAAGCRTPRPKPYNNNNKVVIKPDPGKQDPGKQEPGKHEPGKEDPGKKEPGTEDPPTVDEKYVENQPEFPAEEDDAYFKEPAERTETFRILITRGNYQVRQMSREKHIRRKRDPAGDKYQVDVFGQYSDKINFKDFKFQAVLHVRLNPHSGGIEFIKFEPGKTPRTWQASKFFRDDLARFAFFFPRNTVSIREFKVRYQWRIKAKADLSQEEIKMKAIEYLKSQTK